MLNYFKRNCHSERNFIQLFQTKNKEINRIVCLTNWNELFKMKFIENVPEFFLQNKILRL